jgi:hypothetical protein
MTSEALASCCTTLQGAHCMLRVARKFLSGSRLWTPTGWEGQVPPLPKLFALVGGS